MIYETIVWSPAQNIVANIRINKIEDICGLKYFSWNDIDMQQYREGMFEPIPAEFMTEGLENEILERINE